MNKQICIFIFLLTCRICSAQNLVPNGDFEQYIGCPSATAQLDSSLFWISPTLLPPNGGSPDYYNQCGTGNAGVPQNNFGFQQAHSGNGYSGIIIYYNSGIVDYREFIEVQLTTSLAAHTCYHFSMYINLSNSSKLTSDDISAYFSDTLISGINNYLPLSFTPQFNNTVGNIPDTLNWTLVEGDFEALGGESYLVIGNFKNDAMTTSTLVNNSGFLQQVYMYIDDVWLVQIPPPCHTSVNENNENKIFQFYPNPFSDEINITIKTREQVDISLYDVTSRKIFTQSLTNSTTINTQQLAKGIYLYEVRNKNGVIKKGKVIKD